MLPPLSDPYLADPNVIFLNVTPIKNLGPQSILPPLIKSPDANSLYPEQNLPDFVDNLVDGSIFNGKITVLTLN